MALNLPQNFKNDLAGRDTMLFPLIIIGNYTGDNSAQSLNNWINSDSIHISTNNFKNNYTFEADQVYTNRINALPILLNVPSLKESIDLSTRRYKISSVNIDISNFPYEGKRFYDTI